MSRLRIVYLATGIVLLIATLLQSDLAVVWGHVSDFGLWGTLTLTCLFALAYYADATAWLLTLPAVPVGRVWSIRLFVIRTIGEAFNDLTPLASLGGEPLKSVLLKHHYDVGYRESGASLVIVKTAITAALVVFLGIGFALLSRVPELPASYIPVAAMGLAILAFCTTGFYLVQRLKLASTLARWLHRTGGWQSVERFLEGIHDFDDQLAAFYVGCNARLAGAFALAFASWLVGVIEIMILMDAFGFPVSITQAWVIEALAQLVRAAAFFIPAAIGVQEGTFLLILGALTGSSAIGVAVAVIRRCRQLLWLAVGVALSWTFTLKPDPVPVSEEARS